MDEPGVSTPSFQYSPPASDTNPSGPSHSPPFEHPDFPVNFGYVPRGLTRGVPWIQTARVLSRALSYDVVWKCTVPTEWQLHPGENISGEPFRVLQPQGVIRQAGEAPQGVERDSSCIRLPPPPQLLLAPSAVVAVQQLEALGTSGSVGVAPMELSNMEMKNLKDCALNIRNYFKDAARTLVTHLYGLTIPLNIQGGEVHHRQEHMAELLSDFSYLDGIKMNAASGHRKTVPFGHPAIAQLAIHMLWNEK
ncbi:hypothetical protein PAXRUDRAFT_12990 [Paxillus rubicundulus Ve08.2h10]|uniref:DUF6532 domain-containing protein n=1 Tax=Paxillus rubicundulus Ve08.2h10 TaxID=930991 RepID=A0A0D0E5Q5_9AGAM|nr:hypothetical protein PAXRUDRAFT_12990 [Paxillus rubicundulus Ve08.2h10]